MARRRDGRGDLPERSVRPNRRPLAARLENVYANARNHGYDPASFIDRIPLERIAYDHVAGGIERNGLYQDTHPHRVLAPVLALLEHLCALANVPGVMLERDDRFPTDAEQHAELDAIAAAVRRGTAQRATHVS